MRADYATSDLISKVNSDWINEVLADREFSRTDPAQDGATAAGDLRLRREFAHKRAALRKRGATGSGRHEPDIAIDPYSRRYRPRSVARRIKERLALALAVLAAVAAVAWLAPEPQEVTSAVSARIASAAPEPAAPLNTAELQPAWLVPEILYGPAMARSPVSQAEAPRPTPKPGR